MKILNNNMNKTGKSNKIITVGVIALVLLLAVIGAKVFGFLPQTALGNNGGNGGSGVPYISTGSTALSLAAVDALKTGTSVGTSNKISVNGAAYTAGITSASPNNKLGILVNASGYHNQYVKDYVVPNSPTAVIPVSMNKNSSGVTTTIFNTNNLVVNGVATNQTVAVGGAYTMPIRFDGSSLETTQAMRCIIEASNGTAADKVTFNVAGASYIGNSKPNWYTLSGTNSDIFVYDMPEVANAASIPGTIQITSASGTTLAASSLKVSCFSKEWFIDTNDGQVKFDVEDSLGTRQSAFALTSTVQFS